MDRANRLNLSNYLKVEYLNFLIDTILKTKTASNVIIGLTEVLKERIAVLIYFHFIYY